MYIKSVSKTQLRLMIKKINKNANEVREKYVQKLEKEPDNQYGIQSFKRLFWEDPSEKNDAANDTEY